MGAERRAGRAAVAGCQARWRTGRWTALASVLCAVGVVGLHVLRQSMDRGLRMQAFVASLGGLSSDEYCPAFKPLVREYLKDYYWRPLDANGSTAADPRVRATGAALVPEEEARVDTFLADIGAFPLSIRGGRLTLDLNHGSAVHAKRLADFRANVGYAQQAFGPLPDLEAWFVVGDGTTLPRGEFPLEGVRLPPMGFSAKETHYDVSIPYTAQEVWREAAQLARLNRLVATHPWELKVNRGVWRGSTTGLPEPDEVTWRTLPRSVLVNASLENPDLLDARFTSCKQCHGSAAARIEEAGFGFDSFLTYEDLFRYRMLVDVDGNSWSSRFPQLLSVNSAVFKQETPYREWFRPLLQPNVHYVPVREDLADLTATMRALSTSANNSAPLRAMAMEATRFYLAHLTPSKQLCYLHVLLSEMGRIWRQGEAQRAREEVAGDNGKTRRLRARRRAWA